MTPERFNQWRIAPRLLVILYGVMCFEVATWFMSLGEPNNAQSAFASVVFGAGAAWFKFYVDSGNAKVEG